MPTRKQAPLSRIEMSRTVERGVRFLHTASTRASVLALLAPLGYSPEVHARGWALLLATLGHNQYPYAAPRQPVDTRVRDNARAAIEAYRASDLKRARVALLHHFPDQAKYLFGDDKSLSQLPALAVVTTFLDRCARLRNGTLPARASKRLQDQAAIALLEERNVVNASLDKQLRAWIKTAQRLAPEPATPDDPRRLGAFDEAAREFRSWLEDWRMTATAGIRRRDYLIALGLAARRTTPQQLRIHPHPNCARGTHSPPEGGE